MSGVVCLHIFANVVSEVEARRVGEGISDALNRFGSTELCRLKPYWKIPEYFELSIEIYGPNISEAQITEISSVLGEGWTAAGDSMVWNSQKGEQFMDPRVQWANLEFFQEG